MVVLLNDGDSICFVFGEQFCDLAERRRGNGVNRFVGRQAVGLHVLHRRASRSGVRTVHPRDPTVHRPPRTGECRTVHSRARPDPAAPLRPRPCGDLWSLPLPPEALQPPGRQMPG